MNYGAYAQKLMNYKASSATVTDKLSDISVEDLEGYAQSVSGKVNGVKFQGASLSLQADTVLSAYFKFTGDASDYTVKVNNKKVDVDGNEVVISGIKAADLGQNYTIKVSDGSSTMTVKVSALTWAYSVLSKNNDTKTVNMAKMVYRYNQAAEAYFDAH
jgi:hypothetical protein